MSEPSRPLARSLGLVDTLGLGFNCVVGSGVFLLPGLVAAKLGPASVLATAFAGLLSFLIALCFAEAASRFAETGGPYVYTRAAFGGLAGFEVGWITCWTGVVAWAAMIDAFALALSKVVPGWEEGVWRKLPAALLILALGVVNYRGVKPGARLSSLLTAAKLVPLLAFVLIGAFFVVPGRFEPFAPQGFAGFGEATLIALYAYLGFENLAVPAGEMRSPRSSLPRALAAVLALVTAVYVAVQGVAIGTFEGLAGSENPVVDAARGFLGETGGGLIAAGVLISMLGVNSASALILPRRFFALAENGELPAFLARVHPRFRTPAAALLVCYLLTAVLALTGSFRDLVVLTVVGRFFQYIPTCLAVLAFRRRAGVPPPAFHLPLGPLIPILALLLSGWLLLQAKPAHLLAGAGAALLGLPVYAWFHRRKA